jgi:peroxiredoxin
MSGKMLKEVARMDLNKEIEEMQKKLTADVPGDIIETITSANKKIIGSRLEKGALRAGQNMPVFQLNNHLNRPVASYELLGKGPLIISFYRGSWCPYCSMELNALQKYHEEFTALGAELIAITPELPDGTLRSIKKHKLAFQVLTDIDNRLARKFGLVFTLPEELRDIYRSFGFDLEKANGNDKWQLPIPATYIVNPEGIIEYAFVNADYTKRLEPDTILAQLKKINSEQKVTNSEL